MCVCTQRAQNITTHRYHTCTMGCSISNPERAGLPPVPTFRRRWTIPNPCSSVDSLVAPLKPHSHSVILAFHRGGSDPVTIPIACCARTAAMFERAHRGDGGLPGEHWHLLGSDVFVHQNQSQRQSAVSVLLPNERTISEAITHSRSMRPESGRLPRASESWKAGLRMTPILKVMARGRSRGGGLDQGGSQVGAHVHADSHTRCACVEVKMIPVGNARTSC